MPLHPKSFSPYFSKIIISTVISMIFYCLSGLQRTAIADSVEKPQEPTALQMDLLLNARIMAAEKKTAEVLKLWFAQKMLLLQTNQIGFQHDLLSTIWWAVAQGNVCPDDVPKDDKGAAIWTIALHNHLVANLSGRNRHQRSLPPPFESFERGKQSRHVNIGSKLDGKELGSLKIVSQGCASRDALLNILNAFQTDQEFLNLGNKGAAARVLQMLLMRFRTEYSATKIPLGGSLVQSKLFDLNLFLIEEITRKRKSRDPNESKLMKEFLAEVIKWSVDDWGVLSTERRLFLFEKSESEFPSQLEKETLLFSLLDSAIQSKNGNEIVAWLSQLQSSGTDLESKIWSEQRAQKLMELSEDSGFNEVSYVAFQRALTQLNKGATTEALKSFAFALKWAERSVKADEVRIAARRWLSYSLATFKLDDTIKQFLLFSLPKEDSMNLQEDLAWQAAFRKDFVGYELVLKTLKLPGRRAHVLEKLKPLAEGKSGLWFKNWKNMLENEPNAALKEMEAVLQRIEQEDPEVKTSLSATLDGIRLHLLQSISETAQKKQRSRLSDLTKLLILQLDALLQARTNNTINARNLSPQATTFAGFVRSVPTDRLSSPFVYPETSAPNPFTAIQVEPWDSADSAVLGWRLSE